MSMLGYNIKTIFCFLAIIMGTIWIFIGFGHCIEKHFWKILLLTLCLLIVISMLIGMFLSISYSEKKFSGTVTDITFTGSRAGILNTYTVDIVDDQGNTIRIRSSLFSSSRIKNILDEVAIGDRISVCYGGYFDTLYYIEI